jgi:hypothetical protein
MYEIRQRLCARRTLVKVCPLSAKRIRRNDSLRLEAVSANRTAQFDLTESRHNASSISLKDTKGISVPVFFVEFDYINSCSAFHVSVFSRIPSAPRSRHFSRPGR